MALVINVSRRRLDPLRLSAVMIVAGALLSAPISMLIVSIVAPQPPWQDAGTFAAHIHPVQTLPYVLGYLLMAGFVLFAASCHALTTPALRLQTSTALVATAIYASLVFANYTIQVAYVPRIISLEPHTAGMLTMANPASFGWFLEMFGYAALGVATWLVSGGFGGSLRGLLIRTLLVANGVGSIIGAGCTALYDRWVFSAAGLVSFAAWNLLIVVCFVLIAVTPGGGYQTEPAGGHNV